MKRNEIFKRVENLKGDLTNYNKDITVLNHFDRMNDLLDNLYDVREYENNITEERKIIDFTKVL